LRPVRCNGVLCIVSVQESLKKEHPELSDEAIRERVEVIVEMRRGITN
jgi:hypothetical protein